MPDETANTPGQQGTPPGQQVDGSPNQTTDWEGRYKGSVRTIEKLTLEKRGLEEQLAAKTSEIEQLRIQLGQKDTEHQVAVVERDNHINQTVKENAEIKAKLKELEALKLKVDAAMELGRPDLLKVAARIPSIEDPEALKSIMQDLAGFADEQVKAREKQLLAGITGGTGAGGQAPSAPSSRDGWLRAINEAPLGSPERAKLLDQYGDFLEKQHQAH